LLPSLFAVAVAVILVPAAVVVVEVLVVPQAPIVVVVKP